MSAPRRPGDDRRAGRRPGKTEGPGDAPARSKRPTAASDETIAKPARKARSEGWAKAKPPREKPGRASKFKAKFSSSKAADRPTPMREDGPRRLDEDVLRPTREGERHARTAGTQDRSGQRPAATSYRTVKPSRDAKPDRQPPVARGAKPSRGRETARDDDRADAPRTGRREARGAERAARPSAGTLHPAYGTPRSQAPRTAREDRALRETRPAFSSPRPVREEAPRSPRTARSASDHFDRAERPARSEPPPRDSDRPVGAAARALSKPAAPGKTPNRAARRAELRAAATAAGAAPTSATAPAAVITPFLPGSGTREPQRIAKLLARAGVASRREIERMIEERRIALNGVALETPATILTSLNGVTVDGQPIQPPSATRLFLFHKPPGVLTAERDFSGRPTIYDRLPEDLPRVMPVGRLDLNTEGLLLLTTDGEFKRKLELPSTGIPRIYRARAYGEVTQAMLEDLSDGVEIEGIRYGPIDANLERRTGANVWIEMRITEGKNREVRRVLEYLGLQVSRLIRTAYGEFVLADLESGGIVEVRQNDLVAFRQTLR